MSGTFTVPSIDSNRCIDVAQAFGAGNAAIAEHVGRIPAALVGAETIRRGACHGGPHAAGRFVAA